MPIQSEINSSSSQTALQRRLISQMSIQCERKEAKQAVVHLLATLPVQLVGLKQESKTAEDEEKEAVALFIENKQQNMMLLSCSITELKILQVTAGEHKFTGT